MNQEIIEVLNLERNYVFKRYNSFGELNSKTEQLRKPIMVFKFGNLHDRNVYFVTEGREKKQNAS